jgi:hypothetical protein
MNTDELKQFTDPLLGGVRETKNGRERQRTNGSEHPTSSGNLKLMYGGPLVLILGVLGFFLYQAQQQIGTLSDELSLNKVLVEEMTGDLEESQAEIMNLNEGLESSKSQLASQNRAINQYKTLYSGLKNEQEQQTVEIEAITLEKADRTEVNALKNETTQLQEQVMQTEGKVTEVSQKADQNSTQIAQSQAQIEENQTQLASVQESVSFNSQEIAGVKRSLERDYYNFELQEKGGYMKVFDVSLSLKDTDWKRRQFDMYLLADGKVMQKKDHSINEPIQFYIAGQKKPYEVVVTRVDKKMVVGYLSVPKG